MVIGPSNGDWLVPVVYGIVVLTLMLKPRESTLWFFWGASLCLNATVLIKVGYWLRMPVLLGLVLLFITLNRGYIYKQSIKIYFFALILILLTFSSCFLFYFLDSTWLVKSMDGGGSSIRYGSHRTLIQSMQFIFLNLLGFLFVHSLLYCQKIDNYQRIRFFFAGILLGFTLDVFYSIWEALFVWFNFPFVNITNDLGSYWEMSSNIGKITWHRVRGFDMEPLNLANYTLFSLAILSLVEMERKYKRFIYLNGIIISILTFSRGAILAILLSCSIIVFAFVFRFIFFFSSLRKLSVRKVVAIAVLVFFAFFYFYFARHSIDILIDRIKPTEFNEFGMPIWVGGRGDLTGIASFVRMYQEDDYFVIHMIFGAAWNTIVAGNTFVSVFFSTGVVGGLIWACLSVGWVFTHKGMRLIKYNLGWSFFFLASLIQRISFGGISADVYLWISISLHLFLLSGRPLNIPLQNRAKHTLIR